MSSEHPFFPFSFCQPVFSAVSCSFCPPSPSRDKAAGLFSLGKWTKVCRRRQFKMTLQILALFEQYLKCSQWIQHCSVLPCSGLGKRFYPVVAVVLLVFSGLQVNAATQSSGLPEKQWWDLAGFDSWRGGTVCLFREYPLSQNNKHTQTEGYYLLLLLEIIV